MLAVRQIPLPIFFAAALTAHHLFMCRFLTVREVMQDGRSLNLWRILAVSLVVVAVVRTAWVSDDALITLRNALNISHGWGPGFNATENVQAYTHPMWFLLWLGVGATNQWIMGVFVLSVLFTGIAVSLLVWRIKEVSRLLVVTGFLLLSNAFIDYSASGLETPLSYTAVALLFVLSLSSAAHITSLRMWWPIFVGLSAALVVLTRLDLAVLIVAPLGTLVYIYRRDWRSVLVAIGAFLLPVLVWFLYSWNTYSAMLPNTFAAKTNVDIPQSELVVQGFSYLWVTFENDPVTMIGLAVGVGAGLALGSHILRCWALGVIAYIFYVVWVGGDFMAGRFVAVAFLVAMLVLAATTLGSGVVAPNQPAVSVVGSVGVVLILILASNAAGVRVTSLANPKEPRWEFDPTVSTGVSDERGVYVRKRRDIAGLVGSFTSAHADSDFVPIGDGSALDSPLQDLNRMAQKWPEKDEHFSLPSEVGVMCGLLGTAGIVSGPRVHYR